MAKGKKDIDELKAAINEIEKTYGQGSVMKLGDAPADVPHFSSGSIKLDMALGIGGYPRGRIIEIYGPESSGKTTLAMHAIVEVQKLGGIAAIIDAEQAFDLTYAKNLGINVNDLYISQPSSGEAALEIAHRLIRSGKISLIVIDSVAALTPMAEIEGEMGESKMGLQARLMSQAMRKMTADIKHTETCCIFINQLRDKIGVMFGSPETTTGGNALKFYASIRLDIRKGAKIKKAGTEDYIGNNVTVKVVKNKLAPPFRTASFDIIYGVGINQAGEILDLAVDFNIIKRAGAWYSYNGVNIGQGREASLAILNDNPELFDEVKKKVLDSIKK